LPINLSFSALHVFLGDEPLTDGLGMPHGSEEEVLFEAAVQASTPWPK